VITSLVLKYKTFKAAMAYLSFDSADSVPFVSLTCGSPQALAPSLCSVTSVARSQGASLAQKVFLGRIVWSLAFRALGARRAACFCFDTPFLIGEADGANAFMLAARPCVCCTSSLRASHLLDRVASRQEDCRIFVLCNDGRLRWLNTRVGLVSLIVVVRKAVLR